MSESPFPNPSMDESVDDLFVSPPGAGGDGPMGASPAVNPLESARQSKRWIATVVITVAIMAVAFLFIRSGESDESNAAEAIQTEEVVVASPAQQPATATFDSIAATMPSGVSDLPSVNGSPDGSYLSDDALGLNDIQSGTSVLPSINDIGAPPAVAQAPDATAPQGGQGGYGGLLGDVAAGGVFGPMPADADVLGGLTPSDIARQQALEEERLAEEERNARARAFAEALAAEEERLSQISTTIATADITPAADASGPSRFGASSPTGVAAAAGPSMDADFASRGDLEITPGSRVGAVTVSEFIGDAVGGGMIEARLTQPLRVRGSTILPAGTRAFGEASAGGVTAGQPARLTVTFNTFVTPEGDVIRDITGQAGEPRTLAMSIPAKADYRFLQRAARGALTTAIDLAITSGSDRRMSAFEQPSVRDQAVMDARERFGAMINAPIGDESSVMPTLKLPSGTQIIIMFGFGG